jgi:L-ascorbate metabolism protein UlaG (beta-lactamase superfamily)
MNITKYTHACLVLEKDKQSVVIDPGGFSDDLVIPDTVICIVVTDAHFDHLNMDNLKKIIDKNPKSVVYAHRDIVSQLDGIRGEIVDTHRNIQVGDFALKFVGGKHALVYPDIPQAINLGVIVDDEFYYPGDSFTLPGQPIETLALPVSGPWCKLSEAIDFLNAVKPRSAFPTHDAINSDIGNKVVDDIIEPIAKASGIEYKRI